MIAALARMLGIRDDQVSDALGSERAAKASLTRRGFLAAAAATAVGSTLARGGIFSFYDEWAGWDTIRLEPGRLLHNQYFDRPTRVLGGSLTGVIGCVFGRGAQIHAQLISACLIHEQPERPFAVLHDIKGGLVLGNHVVCEGGGVPQIEVTPRPPTAQKRWQR